MTIAAAIIGFLLGFLFGSPILWRENDCPQIEMGYDCKGLICDHSKSELYRVKMMMAKNSESLSL